MKNNCAFQYYDGTTIKVDETNLTLIQAKELWNENYDDMVNRTKLEYCIEAVIWIDMKGEFEYENTLVHLVSPNVDKDGNLWEKKIIGEFDTSTPSPPREDSVYIPKI